MSTLLVIGGTGFFGKSILDFYQRGGLIPWDIERVIIMSRNAERLATELPLMVSTGVELLSADITTATYLPHADYVIHAAASSDARDYLASPLEERMNIQLGISNYCKLAKIYHKDSKILYVSSGAVYGTQPEDLERVSEDYDIIDLTDIPEGKRDYTYAKRDAEDIICRLGKDGLSVSIARCFAFVGPWLPLDQHFAIGNFIADGLAGRAITVKARYRVYRSYMYVDDLVESLMRIASHSDSQCPVYNVGSDEAVLMGDVAKIVAKEFGLDISVPAISESKVDRYVPDIRKLRDELGFVPKFDLTSSVATTVKAIRNRIQS